MHPAAEHAGQRDGLVGAQPGPGGGAEQRGRRLLCAGRVHGLLPRGPEHIYIYIYIYIYGVCSRATSSWSGTPARRDTRTRYDIRMRFFYHAFLWILVAPSVDTVYCHDDVYFM